MKAGDKLSGVFQIDRVIFDNSIWNNVVEFRVFFYIVGNAVWKEEGVKVGNVHVKRGGQYLRSYRNLREDLMYIENNKIKYYGIATIKRTVDKLVADGRLGKEETEHGTLFTVVNYSLYQGFDRFNIDSLERGRNADGTAAEQQRNNKKKDNKDKNIYISIFEHWNSKGIIRHRKLTSKMETKIRTALKAYTEDEIKEIIDNYAAIVLDDKYWFTYKWTLEDFLQRGMTQFEDLKVAKENYLAKKMNRKKSGR